MEARGARGEEEGGGARPGGNTRHVPVRGRLGLGEGARGKRRRRSRSRLQLRYWEEHNNAITVLHL